MQGVDLISVLLLALCAVLIAVFLKQSRFATAAMLVMLTAGCLVLLSLLPALSTLRAAFSALGQRAGIADSQLALLIKIIGLAYLAEFGAQLCRDAGEGAAALKIELAAKIAILLQALPVIADIIQSVLGLLG